MGWPKGKPRKGHVNKNGSTHAKWGQNTAKRPYFRVSKPALEGSGMRALSGARTPGAEAKARAALDAVRKRRGRPPKGGEAVKKWNTKLTNKGLEPCPVCDFPEAYAGYCDECGWMAPFKYGRIT